MADLQRLRSPLGIALVVAAVFLLLAFLLMRRRRQQASAHARHPASTARSPAHNRRATVAPPPRSPFARRRARQADLVSLLAPYRLSGDAPNPRAEADAETWTLLTVPALKRLSRSLEGVANRVRLTGPLTTLVERAGWQVRLGELLTVWLIATLAVMGFGWALAGAIGALIVLVLGLVSPLAIMQAAADHRSQLFATQLPDVLKLTASSLRAGFSLPQGLEAVTRQLREPSASELQRVLAEARLGRPVEAALEAAAARIRNRDFTESVAAVRIQQAAGGNLATLFDTLAETMVQRLRLRREVRALTAEGRLSAYILGAMPLALALLIFGVNPPYILELFHSVVGKMLLLGGLLLQILGFFWMYRIVKIET